MANPTAEEAPIHPARRHHLRIQRLTDGELPEHHLPGDDLDDEPQRRDRGVLREAGRVRVVSAPADHASDAAAVSLPGPLGHGRVIAVPLRESRAHGSVLGPVAEPGSAADPWAAARQHQDRWKGEVGSGRVDFGKLSLSAGSQVSPSLLSRVMTSCHQI
ncbi:hypothetical protein Nepgr_012977 [Nepenthes gracilis]|uniref:Uncharacterized protein n=1 Tax=Nepenthes gracilis TaxID=150966 RepID=A0AAD3SI27_NEPGR|nr:hypothetical protein Nepgr_012977 [Nepenthes gracilis]